MYISIEFIPITLKKKAHFSLRRVEGPRHPLEPLDRLAAP